MSSGFSTRLDSYQSAQLQRIGRMILIFCMFQVYQLYSPERDNKGADQTAWKCRMVCTFVFWTYQSQLFSCHGPYQPADEIMVLIKYE